MNNTHIVYIIDDDADDQDFLIEAINDIDSSIKCYTACNGQEGLRKLETEAIPFPSMIFLDLNMPRINGHKFLVTIKNHPLLKSIPVIIYTTSENSKEREELQQLGAMDYLVKQAEFSILKDHLLKIFSEVQLKKMSPEIYHKDLTIK
ncbi:MAG: response regulator [Flavitalea sp.]